MGLHFTYTIITHRDPHNLILGYSWEIITSGAKIVNHNLIGSKNECFLSLKKHMLKFLNLNVNQRSVKNREVIGT